MLHAYVIFVTSSQLFFITIWYLYLPLPIVFVMEAQPSLAEQGLKLGVALLLWVVSLLLLLEEEQGWRSPLSSEGCYTDSKLCFTLPVTVMEPLLAYMFNFVWFKNTLNTVTGGKNYYIITLIGIIMFYSFVFSAWWGPNQCGARPPSQNKATQACSPVCSFLSMCNSKKL